MSYSHISLRSPWDFNKQSAYKVMWTLDWLGYKTLIDTLESQTNTAETG